MKATQDANALFCIAIAHLLTHPGDAEGAVAAAEQESIREGTEADPQASEAVEARHIRILVRI